MDTKNASRLTVRRTRTEAILEDLEKKTVLLVGPRQVGKTWLAREIGTHFSRVMYLNYDSAEDRDIMHREAWIPSTELLILDELHKMKGWKNFLKGVYDTKPAGMRMLVTGSARLDVFRQMGDSLAGRYFIHHLMPLSVAELAHQSLPDEFLSVDRLVARGGFPEPFLAEHAETAERWRMQYMDALIRADVFDVASIDDLQNLSRVLELLRIKVGSPISYSNIARDIGISSVTVKKYIQVLEALYLVFTIRPYTHKIARAILKEPKVYFYDTGMVVGDSGVKFENFVAVSLLKHVLQKRDMTGTNLSLAYLRTKTGQEVDFVIADKDRQKIDVAVETKYADRSIARNLAYFVLKYGIAQGVQVVQHTRHDHQEGEHLQVRDSWSFLSELS